MSLYEIILRWIIETPDHLTTKKTHGSCNFFLISINKTQGMCRKVVEEYPQTLCHIPDHLKTQEMCKKAVEEYP